ncbi:MAG: hypothetical protein JXR69_08300 [Candidatus Delongbacteria bacterium]|nr:hypothetical protein [Candidatus Delongbacteria bacterium]
MVLNLKWKYTGRYLSAFFAIIIFFISTSVCGQNTKKMFKDRSAVPKNYNQVQAVIIKADRYESFSEYSKAYSLYNSLIRTNFTDPQVLNGYVRNSVKTNRIKECEIKLKQIILDYKKDEKKKSNIVEIQLESFLGQLFFMTGRDMQGNEIIKLINSSDISNKLKYSTKGRIYFESGSYKNSIDQYLKARTELDDENIFSKELFYSYRSSNMISDAAEELVNIFISEDRQIDREIRFDVFSSKHEMVKLFQDEMNRKPIIKKVKERSTKNKKLIPLLSELYFMNKDYDQSFEVIKNTNIDDDIPAIISFANRLYKDKEYENSANFFSLYFTDSYELTDDDMEQFLVYIEVLLNLNEFDKCIDKLSKYDFPETKIKNAYIFHQTGNWDKAVSEYENEIENLKEFPKEFIDYLKLLISIDDLAKCQNIVTKSLKDVSYHSLRREVEDQLLFIDIMLSLFQNNMNEFNEKYEKLTKDNIIADTDNDIIKVKNQLQIIDGDDRLRNSYFDYLRNNIDPTNKFEIIPDDPDNSEDKAEILFVLGLKYYYLKASKNIEEQSKVIRLILDQDPTSSDIGLLILDYCENNDIKKEERNEIIMELLKGEYSDLIKSRARKIIRQN